MLVLRTLYHQCSPHKHNSNLKATWNHKRISSYQNVSIACYLLIFILTFLFKKNKRMDYTNNSSTEVLYAILWPYCRWSQLTDSFPCHVGITFCRKLKITVSRKTVMVSFPYHIEFKSAQLFSSWIMQADIQTDGRADMVSPVRVSVC
jgi:hypothetical protein